MILAGSVQECRADRCRALARWRARRQLQLAADAGSSGDTPSDGTAAPSPPATIPAAWTPSTTSSAATAPDAGADAAAAAANAAAASAAAPEAPMAAALNGPPCATVLADEGLELETRLQLMAQYDPGPPVYT